LATKEEEAEIRERIGKLARDHLDRGDATGWFEELYKTADGDIDAIPWLDLEPNRFLVEWDRGKIVDGSGKHALVVGCGLGDEALYLADRKYDVTAFDISPKVIEWAKQVHQESKIEFVVADMFEPPGDWIGAFDLVVEVYTIQALPLALRRESIDAIESFVKPGGELVVVQRLRTDEIDDPDGPPWALSRKELKRFEEQGLKEVEFETYLGDEDEPVERLVALYRNTDPKT